MEAHDKSVFLSIFLIIIGISLQLKISVIHTSFASIFKKSTLEKKPSKYLRKINKKWFDWMNFCIIYFTFWKKDKNFATVRWAFPVKCFYTFLLRWKMIYKEMLSPGYRRPLQPFQSHWPSRNVFCLLPSNKKLSWQIFLVFAREDAPLLVLSLSKTATAYLSIIFDASMTPLNISSMEGVKAAL